MIDSENLSFKITVTKIHKKCLKGSKLILNVMVNNNLIIHNNNKKKKKM
jgi:hypothetical protein